MSRMLKCEDGDGGIEGCGASWTGTAKAHCTTCHQTFGGSRTADMAHKYPAEGIVCYDPTERGLTLDPAGVWRRPAPPQSARH